MLTFHSFRALGSTYSRLHHRLSKSLQTYQYMYVGNGLPLPRYHSDDGLHLSISGLKRLLDVIITATQIVSDFETCGFTRRYQGKRGGTGRWNMSNGNTPSGMTQNVRPRRFNGASSGATGPRRFKGASSGATGPKRFNRASSGAAGPKRFNGASCGSAGYNRNSNRRCYACSMIGYIASECWNANSQ